MRWIITYRNESCHVDDEFWLYKQHLDFIVSELSLMTDDEFAEEIDCDETGLYSREEYLEIFKAYQKDAYVDKYDCCYFSWF